MTLSPRRLREIAAEMENAADEHDVAAEHNRLVANLLSGMPPDHLERDDEGAGDADADAA
jgi:hypothetical protein